MLINYMWRNIDALGHHMGAISVFSQTSHASSYESLFQFQLYTDSLKQQDDKMTMQSELRLQLVATSWTSANSYSNYCTPLLHQSLTFTIYSKLY